MQADVGSATCALWSWPGLGMHCHQRSESEPADSGHNGTSIVRHVNVREEELRKKYEISILCTQVRSRASEINSKSNS